MSLDFVDDPRLHDLDDLPVSNRRERLGSRRRLLPPSRPAVEGIGSLREILPLEEFTGPDGRRHALMATHMPTRQETRASRDLEVFDPSTGETFVPGTEPDLFTLHHLTGDHRFNPIPDEARRGGRAVDLRNESALYMTDAPDNGEDVLRDLQMMRDHERMQAEMDFQNRLFDERYDARMSSKDRRKMKVQLLENVEKDEFVLDEKMRRAYDDAMSGMQRQMDEATGGLRSSKMGTARALPASFDGALTNVTAGSYLADDGDVRARGQAWYHSEKDERGSARDALSTVSGGARISDYGLELLGRTREAGADRMRGSERMASSKRRIRFEGVAPAPNLESAGSTRQARSDSRREGTLGLNRSEGGGGGGGGGGTEAHLAGGGGIRSSRADSEKALLLKGVRAEPATPWEASDAAGSRIAPRRDSAKAQQLRESRVAAGLDSGLNLPQQQQQQQQQESRKGSSKQEQLRNARASVGAVGDFGDAQQMRARPERRAPDPDARATIVHPSGLGEADGGGGGGGGGRESRSSRAEAHVEAPLRAARSEQTPPALDSLLQDGRMRMSGRAQTIRRLLESGTDLDPGFVSRLSLELAALPQQMPRRELVQKVVTRALDQGMGAEPAALAAASVVAQLLTTSRDASKKAQSTLRTIRGEGGGGAQFEAIHRLARRLARTEIANVRGEGGGGGGGGVGAHQQDVAASVRSDRALIDGGLRTARVDGPVGPSVSANDFDSAIDRLSRPARNMRRYVGAGAPVSRHEAAWEGQGLDLQAMTERRAGADARHMQRAHARAEAAARETAVRARRLAQESAKQALESTPWMAQEEELAAFRRQRSVRGGKNTRIMNLPTALRMEGDRGFSEDRLRQLSDMEMEARERGVRVAVYDSSGDESSEFEEEDYD